MNKTKKSIKKNKRAVVEVQFNWIFILIAGALILGFFFIIITKQKTLSDKKLSVEILNSMDRIMSGQKTSENRQDVIELFSTAMSYSCGGCDCAMSIGGMSKKKGNLILFAPSYMKSDMLLTWTQSWDMPFRVTNFVYMSIPEIKYYFIGPPENIQKDFIKNLPVNLTYEVVSTDKADEIKYKGEQKVRLVFFSPLSAPEMPSGLKGVSDPIISALAINDAESSTWYNGKATLRFYRKSGADFVEDKDEEEISNSYPVLSMQTAYGAVYSDSFQNFKCNADDAINRLRLVSNVYRQRADILSLKAMQGDIFQGCSIYYATDYFNGFEIDKTSLFENKAELYESIGIITIWNDGSIISSCPRIY
jgi:hypothetical protein